MQILDDLYVETRRLFIAGSKFAKDDPRILKYIPTLEKMGGKAPIMKKLAEKYVILTNEGQPEALASVGIFLYAVMATQGSTEISGEYLDISPSISELPKTSTPYSRIRPIIDALTLSMQGRHDIIKTAFEEGLLNDFRIYEYIVAALDDKYSAITYYIYETVIPDIGSILIPYLLEQYDPKGKQGDAMRISLLSELGYENSEALAFKAIEEGSVSVAVESIKILGNNPENEKYLLTLANDKKSEIREAALIGLIRMDSSSGKENMMKLLQGSKYKSAIQAAKLCTDVEYTNKFLTLLKPSYDSLFAEELKDDEFQKDNNKFAELLPSLESKNEPEIYEFYKQILKDERYDKKLKEYKTRSYSINDIQIDVCRHLFKLPKEKMVMICEEAMSIQIAKKFYDVIIYYYNTLIARKSHTDEEIFSIFSKYYEADVIDFIDLFCSDEIFSNYFKDKEDMEAEFKRIRSNIDICWKRLFIQKKDIFSNYFKDKENMEVEFKRIRSNIDIRWKRLFIQKEDIYAMCVLLCKEDEYEKEMKEVILRKVKSSADKKRTDFITGLGVGKLVEISNDKNVLLFKSELEKVAKICYEVFEKIDGYQLQYFYEGIGIENIIKLFSGEYTEKFQNLSKKKASFVFKVIGEALSSNQEK